MSVSEPVTTYLELRQSAEDGSEGSGLSHAQGGLFLLHVLEVAAAGEPSGGVTVVHGAGDHGGRYIALARRLAEAGWAVALPDLRGHGRSEGARGHSAGLGEVLRDLAAVQDHLAYRLPDSPKVLLGQGLGAIHALAFALENPGSIAALVLCGPLWEPAFELPKKVGGLKGLFKKVGPTTPGSTGVVAERLTSDAEQRAAWSADELTHDVITLSAGDQAIGAARAYGPRLGEVDVPVLLLHGAEDTLASAEVSRRKASGCVEVRILEGKRHDLFHERGAEELGADLCAWMETAVRS